MERTGFYPSIFYPMDDAGPSSPIIRSSWKPNPSVHQAPSVIHNNVSPATSFMSVNTVSPLTGFRESATVTDVSWATAFQTPTKLNSTKQEKANASEDVFVITHAEQSTCFPQMSEVDISMKDVTENSIYDPENSREQNNCDVSPTKPKALSASEILSNFRSNTLFSYPKPPISKAKNAAFFSTPKADRLVFDIPEPPESAIVSSSRYQVPTMRLRMCPCGTCSCPAVYLKDAGVQTVVEQEANTPENVGDEDAQATGSLTQLVASEIGKYDGYTQQSIIQETAKASRIRPKSVVTFKEKVDDLGQNYKFPKSAAPSFKTAGSGKAISAEKKGFDARKLFGEDFDAVRDGIKDHSNSFEDNPPPVAPPQISTATSSFKKAGSGATISFSNKRFDAKKFFGEAVDPVDVAEIAEEEPSKAAATGLDEAKVTTASSFSSFKKAGSGAPISVPKTGFDARKFFGEDLTEQTENGLSDGNQKHLDSSISEKVEKSSLPTKSAAKIGTMVKSSPEATDALLKARSIFGDEDLDAALAGPSSFVGFKSSKTISKDEPAVENNKTTDLISSTMATCADGSDVESVYEIDSDIEVAPDADAEIDSLNGFMTPDEIFSQAPGGVDRQTAIKLHEARSEQNRMLAETASKSTSPSGFRQHGIMWRTRYFASDVGFQNVANFKPNFDESNVDVHVLQILLKPHEMHLFPAEYSGNTFVVKWQTVDGGLLVSSDDGSIGPEECKTCLMTTPGVDPKLIPEGWVENHYRMIVWKLAKEVFAFRSEFPTSAQRLNAECVMQQLKYRYDREIDLCQRPCIRRIVEKDSSSKRIMVLCVLRIVQPSSSDHNHNAAVVTDHDDQHSKDSTSSSHGSSSSTYLELTDGWYAISAHLDAPLQRMVNSGRIFVGCKLVIAGAELNGLEEGVDPLHVPAACHLRLSANSTRLASRWWSAKLGWVNKPSKLCVPVRSLFAGGGNANAIKGIVARIYPLLFVEKRLTVGGATDCLYRLESDEAAEAERAKAAQERKVEELMSKMVDSQSPGQSPKPGGKRRKITAAELKELTTGEEIATALRESFDPESVEQMLTEAQCNAFRQYMASRSDRMARKLQAALEKTRDEPGSNGKPAAVRNVTPVLKLFIVGISDLDRQTETNAVLSIWRPPENARDMLQEGRAYYFHNVSVSRPPSPFNNALLNGTQNTSWQPLPLALTKTPIVEELFVERKNCFTRDFQSVTLNQKLGSLTNREIDLVGVILRSVNSPADHACRRLFFVDAEGEIGLIQGIAIGFSNFVAGDCSRAAAPAVFVATNLRLNPAMQSVSNPSLPSIPSAFAQDYSTFTYLTPSTTSVPPRLVSTCRHLESTIKNALLNRASLAENGVHKLESILKLCPTFEEVPRSVSRADFRNVSFLGSETGPQRPGSSASFGTATKAPASSAEKVTGPELQKRKMERLDRYCANSSINLPSPLPADTTSTRARSVLRRAFRPPLKSSTSQMDQQTPSK